jgi:hypothetical protein
VNAAGGIALNATGSIRILGTVTGFTGLTAWGDIFTSTTAGGITQTKPNPTTGGAQIAIAKLGFATSTTDVMVKPEPVQYMRRASLADQATLQLQHHADAQGRLRLPRAYIASTGTPNMIQNYDSANQDTSVVLRGASGAGGTSTVDVVGTTVAGLGNIAGSTYRRAQSFQVTAGILSQFTVNFAANTGTPTGTVTWEIQTDNAGNPSGTVLQTGTFTPTASTNNTVTVTSGIYMSASTTYWLVLSSTSAQSSNNYWGLNSNASGTYALGVFKADINNANTWTGGGGGTNDLRCTITTAASSALDALAQSFQITTTTTIDQVKLWLKKTGTPTGTLTIRIETNNAGSPSGTLANANATVTVAESSLSTSYGWITADFATNFSLTSATTYWIVVTTDRASSGTNYVEWGADGSTPGYANGEMRSQVSPTWSAESKDACFELYEAGTGFDEPCVAGRWSGGTRDVGVRFDDNAGANQNTYTTFKNVMGVTADVTVVVELS